MNPATFCDAYGGPRRHADMLRVQHERNMADLLAIVNESVQADNVCTGRMAPVDKTLEKALGSTDGDAPRPGTGNGPAAAQDDDRRL